MATLTLTVNDSLVPRLLAAYDVSTNAQLKTAIINQIKDRVIDHERLQATISAQTALSQAQSDYEATVNAAETKAQTEIVLT